MGVGPSKPPLSGSDLAIDVSLVVFHIGAKPSLMDSENEGDKVGSNGGRERCSSHGHYSQTEKSQ